MAELEHDVARAVDALRSKRSPPVDAKARVLAAVEARLGDPDPEPEPEDPGSGPTDGGSVGGGFDGVFAAKVVGATTALTGGGLLVVKLGVLAIRSLVGAPEPEIQSQPRPEIAVVERFEAPATTRVEPVEPEPTVETDQQELAPEPTPVSAAPKRASPSEPSVAKPGISAELALIEAARGASSPDATIAELREHARRFPDGVLRDEREALWAIASCEREDFVDAKHRAEALAARRPNSPLLDRVAKACPTGKK